jgi:nucleoside-diphosphate-sugar epimerase
MKIAVTGGNGKLGRAVVTHLQDAGHWVLTLDAVGERGNTFTRIDLTDYGQVVDALMAIDDRHSGLDAVVHLAAIPAGGIAPDSATFSNNMLSTFNVFQAARRAGITRIVYASSETLLGIPFETPPPYLPVDEEYASRPESVYSVVKHLEEELATKLVRWDPSLSITALRFSNVLDTADYALVPGYQNDASLRRWNLWGYIDTRDGAQAVERALEANLPGFDTFIIAAADTLMEFPGVEFTREVAGTNTLLSIDKARRLLGYEPQHSWRD